jgi:hypothetical protein
MNATQVLKKLIKQADSFDKTVITVTMYKELLRQAIKYDVNKDVPTI